MKTILILLILVITGSSYGQITNADDSLKEYYGKAIPVYTKDYLRKYNRMKRIVVKVYPYALYAADIIDEIEQNAASINKRRKKK